jgi:hypothetical protein
MGMIPAEPGSGHTTQSSAADETPESAMSDRTSWIECWTWLVDDLCLAVCSLARNEGIPPDASIVREDQETALDLRAFGNAAPLTPSRPARSYVLLLEFPQEARTMDARACLRIRYGSQTSMIGVSQITRAGVGLDRLADAIRRRFDVMERAALMNVLASSLGKRRGPGMDRRLSQQLFALRQSLRPQLPRADVAKDKPHGLHVDLLQAADETVFYLTAWLHDRHASVTRLTAIAPEGQRVELLDGLSRHPRPDVKEKYVQIGINLAEATYGFVSTVRLNVPSFQDTGWLLELHTSRGPAIEAICPAAAREPASLWERVLRDINRHSASPRLLATHVQPVQRALLRRAPQQIRIKEVAQFGVPNPSSAVSVVVALADYVDALEHQLAQFANDPEMAGADLIYVMEEAHTPADLGKLAFHLVQLYRVPFRIVIVGRKQPWANHSKVGVSFATGRLVLFLSRHVLPCTPGWLGRLTAFYDATPQIGALAPKLVHEDGCLHHSGVMFAKRPFNDLWEPTEPLKGFDAGIPQANVQGRVPGVGKDCLMIERGLYKHIAPSGEYFLTERYEAADLCLRLRGAGRENWYQPGVELHFVQDERPSNPPAASLASAQESYDAWHFDRVWSARLARETVASNGEARLDEAPIMDPYLSTELSSNGQHRLGLPDVPPGDTSETSGVTSAKTSSAASMVEIFEVRELPFDHEQLWGARIERPQNGHREDTYAVEVEGWVLGRSSVAVAVEVVESGIAVYKVPVQLRRHPQEKTFPSVPEAAHCGFRIAINVIRLPPAFEVLVQAVLADGRRVPLGVLQGRRAALDLNPEAGLHPLMVNTLGRSGSTWLIALLGEHPQLVAYDPFDYETRVTGYWLAVVRALTEPLSYTQALRGELYGDEWWLGTQRPSPMPQLPQERQIRHWLCGEHITTLIAFCRNRISSLFQQVAAARGQEQACYFVEKVYPNLLNAAMLAELYPKARNLFLVRDFRDMACSMVAFSKRLKREAFGPGSGVIDEALFRLVRDQAQELLECWNAQKSNGCLVRYEDLIGDTPGTLHSVLKWLGLDDSLQTINNVVARAAQVRPGAQREHQTSEGVPDSFGRWRRELDPAMKGICREILANVLTAFGYDID